MWALGCGVCRRAWQRGPRMLFLKRCPRCKGDIHVNKDTYGHFMECLQCGFAKDLPDPMGRAVVEEPDRPAEVVALPVAAEERLGRAS